MRNHTLNYVAVGLLVIAMLAAAIGSALLLTGRAGPADPYYIVLDNVADVKFGTLVRYEGYPMGQVEAVTPIDDGPRMRFRVDISVHKGWRIPDDSIARIGSSSLLSTKTIDIAGGIHESPVPVGGQITGAATSDLFAAAASMAGEIGDLNRDGLRPLIEQVSGMVANMDAIVEQDLKHLASRLAAVAETVERQVPVILGGLEESTIQATEALAAVRRMVSQENIDLVHQTLQNVESASDHFDAVGRELGGTAEELDRLIRRVDGLIAQSEDEAKVALENAGYVLRSIAQSIDTINQDIEGAARNMNEFSRLIRQNPSALLGLNSRQGSAAPVGRIR